MIHEHLKNAAGVAKILRMFDIEVLQGRVNNSGAQLLSSSPVPMALAEHVDDESELGQFIFGVWVKHEKTE